MYKQPNQVKQAIAILATLTLFNCAAVLADPVTGLNTFVAGQPATAASVNANFSEVETSVNDNDSRITTNSGDIGINTTNITSNTGTIGTNTTNVTSNTSDIGTNTADILTNVGDIGTNASDIADNFSAITGNTSDIGSNFSAFDGRITALEAGSGIMNQTVAIDCVADANALFDTTLGDFTTYVLTGMCNGPIQVSRLRNVIFEGDPAGVPKDDGIVLLAGLLADPFAALGVYEANVEIRDLTIDALNYAVNSYPWNATGSVSAINVGQHAITRIYDVDVEGGDYGISVFRQAYVKTYDNVNVQNFNLYGVEAWGNAHVEFRNTIDVIGAATTTATYPTAVNSGSGGFVQIKDGGTFTPAGSGSGDENYSMSAFDNSVIQVVDSGTSSINGDVISMRGSSIKIQGGTTITGYVGAYDAGKIRLEGGTIQSGGPVEAYRNSTIRVEGGSSITGDLNAGDTSSIRIQGSSTVIGNLDVGDSSSIDIRETSSLTGNIAVSNSSSLSFSDSTHSGGTINVDRNATALITDSSLGTGDVNGTGNANIVIFNSTASGSINFNCNTNCSLSLDGGGPFSGAIDTYNTSFVYLAGTSFTGSLDASSRSVITIDAGTVTGDVIAQSGSTVNMFGASHSGGEINSVHASSIHISSSTINTSGFSFQAGQGSHIEISGTTSVTASSSISLTNYSTLVLRDTTDLGFAGVNCQEQSNQFVFDIGVTSIGSLGGCP